MSLYFTIDLWWGILTSSRLLLWITIMLCQGSIVWRASEVTPPWSFFGISENLGPSLSNGKSINFFKQETIETVLSFLGLTLWPKNGRRRGADRDHLEVSVLLGWRLACGGIQWSSRTSPLKQESRVEFWNCWRICVAGCEMTGAKYCLSKRLL